jgi:hypothetical protein
VLEGTAEVKLDGRWSALTAENDPVVVARGVRHEYRESPRAPDRRAGGQRGRGPRPAGRPRRLAVAHGSLAADAFPGELHEGAHGGHGPIRYTVVEHRPGRLVRFRFTGPTGLHGEHRFEVEARDGGALLRDTLEGWVTGRMLVGWPLVLRPLHDALIEDALDRAEVNLADRPSAPRSLPLGVRAYVTLPGS